MSRHERALDGARLSHRVPRALAVGRMEVLGLLPGASNATLLTRCVADDDEVYAVYKPARGETPLWDFPQGTLHRREVAAYVVACALGWPNVPPTILRDGPAGPGSAQLFVEADAAEHYFTLEDRFGDAFRRVALFDLVVNNADRKAGHCLLGDDGTIWVIDHGVCFAAEPKLRTVIWDYVGEPMPEDLLADLRRLRADLAAAGPTGRELATLLGPDEIDATSTRIDELLAAAVFPAPGPGRPFPWPPI